MPSVITERVDEALQLIRAELAHEVGGNPVVRVGQAPLDGHHLAITLLAGVTRAPRLTVFINQGLLYVAGHIARREPVLHS